MILSDQGFFSRPICGSSGLICYLLLGSYVVFGTDIPQRSHFFHGTKHSYNHNDAASFGTTNKPQTIFVHPYKIPLPEEFISKYEYELEFMDDIAMVQLDHEAFIENVEHIECVDSDMNDIDICFRNNQIMSEFTRDLKNENMPNSSFVIASSDENQWKNCGHIKEISLLRMADLNNCISDNGCLKCRSVTKINHNDIIQNGYIRFHTNVTKAKENIIPTQMGGRSLLQSTVTYHLSVDTCVAGGTADKIWIIIEGDYGVTSPVYSLAMVDYSSTYNLQWEGDDVGTIRKMYFVNYGSDDFRVDNINLNGESAGMGWDWLSCPLITYEGSSSDGCGVGIIDFDANDYSTQEQSPCTIIPIVKTPAPIHTPAPIDPSGRTYTIDIDVVFGWGQAGSDDLLSFVIIGQSGSTTSFTATLPAITTYRVTHTDATDVGIITNIHLVMFGSDDLCFDKLVIDDTYTYDSSCTFCGSHCIGYNSWQQSGCNVIDIDFVTGELSDDEEIPCSTLPASGNILQDSWVVTGLKDILENVVGGDKTGDTTYTGTESIEKSMTSIERTFNVQFDSVPSVTIDGTMTVENNLKLELEFLNGAVTRYYVGLSYDAGIELIMSLLVDIDVNVDKSLFDTEFPALGIDVGFIRFGIFIGMNVHAGLTAEIDANYVCTFSYNVFGDIGLELTAQNEYSPSSSMEKDFQFECSSFTASATATVSVYPIFFVRVDYVLDNKNIITASAKPFIEAAVNFDSNAENGCYLGMNANFGLQIVVASPIVDRSWTLFNDKWPVFSGCLDSLLTLSIGQIANIAQNAVLYVAQNLCSTSYSTTNRKNSIVSLNDICPQTELESSHDENNNTTSHMFGPVNTVWNGRIHPLSTFQSSSPQTKALQNLNYETYQTVYTDEERNSAGIVVLYQTIIEDYNSSGLALNCFFTILQEVNETSLTTGLSNGIVDTECTLGSNVTSDESYGGIYWWLYNFKQMKVHIAKRLFFAELLTTKTFQTNVDFDQLAFSASDNGKIFYGGVGCNVCENDSSCDRKMKSFALMLYEDGTKAMVLTNYMMYPIYNLSVSYNSTTDVTCIGDIMCGSMAYTTENNGNRYYFGQVLSPCYTKTFCGNDVNSYEYDHYVGEDDILPLFVFNEYAATPYNDELYIWESSITASDNTEDNCNGNSSNTFTTTTTPQPTMNTTNVSYPTWIYCGDTVSGQTAAEYDIHYYVFYLSNNSIVEFDSCASDFDTYLYLFDFNATLLAECDDCGSCGSRAQLKFSPLYNGTYFLGIGGYSHNFGAYQIDINCSEFAVTPNAITQPIYCGTSLNGQTTSAEQIVNYSFVLNNPIYYGTDVVFSSCGSEYDTYLWVYDNGALLYSNDDSGECSTTSNSILEAGVLYNGNYTLSIGGFNGAVGNFVMNVTCHNDTAVALNYTVQPINCGDSISGYTTTQQDWAFFTFRVNGPDSDTFSATFSLCGSNFDTVLFLFDNYSNQSYSNDDSESCGMRSVLTADILYNTDYGLIVSGYNGAFGDFVLNVSCSNDTDADIIVRCDDSFSGYTSANSTMANYSFLLEDPSNNGLYVTFSLCGSDYDTYVWLFDDDSNQLYSNDDGSCGLASILTTDILYNGSYELRIGGFSGAFGNFIVNISCSNYTYSTTAIETTITTDTTSTTERSVTTSMDGISTTDTTSGTETSVTTSMDGITTTDTSGTGTSVAASMDGISTTVMETTVTETTAIVVDETVANASNMHQFNILFAMMLYWILRI